jgi:AcrR family transcriptional regulator
MKSRKPTAPLKDRKQKFVREAIWDAAIDLFGEHGFEQTTVEDIARAAGVSRRTFFRYFASKGDLMGQGIVTYGEALHTAIDDCPLEATPLQVMRHTVLEVAAGAALYPRTRKVLTISMTSPVAREAQLARLAEVEDQVAQAFGMRFGDGTKDGVTARLLAGLTLTVLDVTFRQWLNHDEDEIMATAKRVFDELTRLLPGARPSLAAVVPKRARAR